MLMLVTGGAGFIGSHLTDALLAEGHQVRVLDNLATGRYQNLPSSPQLEFVRGDIRDVETVQRCSEGVSVVFHQAALPSVPRSIADPVSCHEVNVTGTLNVLLAARDAGVRRVVYASSSSVYGNTAELPKREAMPGCPLSPYAAAKLAGEHYARLFHQLYGLETVGLRYFNVFGPRQNPHSEYAAAVPKFIRMILAGEQLPVHGDGEQTRDFTPVANVVDANLAAAFAPLAAGKVYNVGCGGRISLNGLLRLMAGATGLPVRVEYLPAKEGDVRDSLAAIDAAASDLGYRPRVGIEAALAELVDDLAGGSITAAAGRELVAA
jgi:nucleoside-diphosphate-sugar epimerase